ncbi:hypothetical protein OKW46_007145 [Paraburkholderia sp. WSM4179]|nr:hypothetical protein [Paraburkholderia sp. WSM4179]
MYRSKPHFLAEAQRGTKFRVAGGAPHPHESERGGPACHSLRSGTRVPRRAASFAYCSAAKRLTARHISG